VLGDLAERAVFRVVRDGAPHEAEGIEVVHVVADESEAVGGGVRFLGEESQGVGLACHVEGGGGPPGDTAFQVEADAVGEDVLEGVLGEQGIEHDVEGTGDDDDEVAAAGELDGDLTSARDEAQLVVDGLDDAVAGGAAAFPAFDVESHPLGVGDLAGLEGAEALGVELGPFAEQTVEDLPDDEPLVVLHEGPIDVEGDDVDVVFGGGVGT